MKRGKGIIRITAALVAILMLSVAIFGMLLTVQAAAQAHGFTSVSTSARAMACVEASTGRVLYTKNADEALPMASTTKIVTAITVIENVTDLDEIIEVNPKSIGIEGTSIYLQRGEELSVRELLLGLMLRSGNDAATALALHVSPTIEGFCAKMKQTSERAGATNSNYKNPHGLDEDGHYTTALDLALISAYAMNNPTFREIVGTKSAKISGKEYPRVLHNKNRLLQSLDGCVGVKTGFTKKAGRCYVGAREHDGMTVVCAVLNCGPMFEDTEAIMKQAANDYTLTRLLTADEFITPTPANARHCEEQSDVAIPPQNTPRGIARTNFFYPLRDDELTDITIRLDDDNVCIFLRDTLIHCTGYNRI